MNIINPSHTWLTPLLAALSAQKSAKAVLNKSLRMQSSVGKKMAAGTFSHNSKRAET